MSSTRLTIAAACAATIACCPPALAQSRASTPWLEGAIEASEGIASAPYTNSLSPSGRVGVAVPIARRTLLSLDVEDIWSTPPDVYCVNPTAQNGLPCIAGRGFGLTGFSALLTADGPHVFPRATAGVGLGAYQLHGDWGTSGRVLGIPLRIEVPVFSSGSASIQAEAHSVVIPRIDGTSVLSFGIGLAARARTTPDQ